MQKKIEHVVKSCPKWASDTLILTPEHQCRNCEYHEPIVGDLFECKFTVVSKVGKDGNVENC